MEEQEPVFVGLLFADRVIIENNNKKGIIGTFNRFFSQQFPVVFPPWYVYAAVTNLTGEHVFALNLVSDETTHVVFSIGGKFSANEKFDVVEIAPPIMGATFQQPGSYTLTFNIDGGTPLGARILKVDVLQQQQAST